MRSNLLAGGEYLDREGLAQQARGEPRRRGTGQRADDQYGQRVACFVRVLIQDRRPSLHYSKRAPTEDGVEAEIDMRFDEPVLGFEARSKPCEASPIGSNRLESGSIPICQFPAHSYLISTCAKTSC